jgi:hypothetical protein
LQWNFLNAALKDNPFFKGIEINKSKFLVSQYADDSPLSQADDENSLNEALHAVNLYSTCSGLRANFDKTHAIWSGVRMGCGSEFHTYPNNIWNHSGSFKLLGIQYRLLNKINIY